MWRKRAFLGNTVLNIIGDSTDDLINVKVRALIINSKENMVGKLRGSNFIFNYADRL